MRTRWRSDGVQKKFFLVYIFEGKTLNKPTFYWNKIKSKAKQPNIEMDHLFSFLLSFIFFFLHNFRELGWKSFDENGAVVRKKAPVVKIFALETFQ